MAKKYDLTTEELLTYFHQFEDEELNEPFTGFAEEDIAEVEQKYNISFPKFHRDYMLRCGAHPINSVFDRICPPDEIASSYDYLEDDIDEYAKELAEMSEADAMEACKQHAIYRLCQLPRAQWHTIVPEYILTWCENQGCWNAGYLRRDLEAGVADPPMYISTNDDFITFEKAADNTAAFLKDIFFMVSYCVNNISECDEDVPAVLEQAGVDPALTEKSGVHFCLDTDTNILYACLVLKDGKIQLNIVNASDEYDEDDEEDL